MKKLSNINESLWSDIQDRNSGEVVRKEDDVDLMGVEEFADYLTNHYTIQNGDRVNMRLKIYPFNRIDIPLIKDEKYCKLVVYYKSNKNTPDSINLYIYQSRTIKYIIEKIKEQFNLFAHASNSEWIEYDVSKKDGSKGTNSFIVEFIDFVQDNLRPPHEKILIKK